jgi:hypothetical protein
VEQRGPAPSPGSSIAVTAYQELSQDSCQMFPDAFRSQEGVARSPKLENRNFARPHGAVRNEAPAVDGVAAPSLTW